MAALDELQRLLGGAGVPAMPVGDLGKPEGYTADVLGYLQDVVSGRTAAGGALAQNTYDPGRSFAQNALDPRGIENATDVAFGIGPGAIRAWHASPYDFNKFDISKVGTGQGAQSYGHGIYVAESPAVSGKGGQYDLEFTAKNLGKYDLNPGELLIHRMLRANRSDMDILGELAKGGGYTFDEAAAALNRVKAAKAKMYEVNINANPEQFLNWDKPLSEQPAGVRKALGDAWLAHPDAHANQTGQQIYEEAAKQHNPEFEAAWGSPNLSYPSASSLMEQAGIPGIRYLDQGSRGAGQGTSNYVVFDPSIIEILRKYGILPPLAAGGLLGGGQTDTP